MQQFRLAFTATISLLLSAAIAAPARAGADFNGDGIDDLVIGHLWQDVNGVPDAGEVEVIYGVSGQPIGSGTIESWNWQTLGLPFADEGEHLGSAVEAGDFNGDGISDLAIGSPNRTVKSIFGSGAVIVLTGSLTGLGSPKVWSQATKKIKDKPEIIDPVNLALGQERFGHALAAGDFNNDGRDDLAIGVFENTHGKAFAGAIQVLFGSANGLHAKKNRLFSQDTTKMKDKAEVSDQFGADIAAADFNGDGFADLAIGVPGEIQNGVQGAVQIMFGSPKGLRAKKNRIIYFDDIAATTPLLSDFGRFVATGDFNGDGNADLVVSNFSETVGAADSAGAVYVIPGSAATGPDLLGLQTWTQDVVGLGRVAADGDFFGVATASGDFDGDNFDDLAIGCPIDTDGVENSGTVLILKGSINGLVTAGNQLWSQESVGVAETGEDFDDFGSAFAIGDFDDNGAPDLVIGVPGEDLGLNVDAGGVVTLYGTLAVGLSSTGSQFLSPGGGLPGAAADSDFFGLILGP